MKDFAEQGRYLENLTRPHSTLGIGPPSPTLPTRYDGRSVAAMQNVWDIRQKEAWRIHPTFLNSKGAETPFDLEAFKREKESEKPSDGAPSPLKQRFD